MRQHYVNPMKSIYCVLCLLAGLALWLPYLAFDQRSQAIPMQEEGQENPETLIESIVPWFGLCKNESIARTIEGIPAQLEPVSAVINHFAQWDWSKGYYIVLDAPKQAYVSYLRGGNIWWTRKPMTLKSGEVLLCVSPQQCIRQHCCNEISLTLRYPIAPPEDEPKISWLMPPEQPIKPPSVDDAPPSSPKQFAAGPLLLGLQGAAYAAPATTIQTPESSTGILLIIGLCLLFSIIRLLRCLKQNSEHAQNISKIMSNSDRMEPNDYNGTDT